MRPPSAWLREHFYTNPFSPINKFVEEPSFKMRPTALLILLFALLSVVATLKADRSYQVFTSHNGRVFDGVQVEYLRQKLHARFNGDHSVRQRIVRGGYELVGNPAGGAYQALLCVLAPHWLSTGADIPIRAAGAMFIMLVAMWLYLRPCLAWEQIALVSLLVTLLPGLYDPNNGIGTYVPDSVASMMLVSGLLFILTFNRDGDRPVLLVAAMTAFAFAVAVRWNFAIHCGLVAMVMAWPTIRTMRALRMADHRAALTVLVVMALAVTAYFAQFLTWFLRYYNETNYGQVDLPKALAVSIDAFLSSYGLWGIVLLLSVAVVGALNIDDTRPSMSIGHVLLLCLPFVLLFGIPVVIKRSPYNPHVLNSAFLTLPLVMMALGQLFRNVLRSSKWTRAVGRDPRPWRVASVAFAFVVITLSTVSYSRALQRVSATLPLHVATSSIGHIVAQEAASVFPDTLRYMGLYDDLLQIPINTFLMKDHGLPIAPFLGFITQSSLMPCKAANTCIPLYVNELRAVGLVAVNDPSGGENMLYRKRPLAQAISVALYAEVSQENSGFTAIDTVTSEIHGRIIVFRRNIPHPQIGQ
ncbi:MAG: hypothetical protein K9J06_03790 [Flavobacteriales bacterium]|nr:hypothetical protein [Flavobacteriales bacterium]